MAKQTFTTGQVLTAAQMTSLQQTAMGGGSTTDKTVSYTLVAADAGTVVQMNSASATTITVNTALFAAGDTVQIQNIGAGVCTVTAGTATVSTAGSLALSQYEGGQLYFNTTSAALFFDVVQSSSTSALTLITSGTFSSVADTSTTFDNVFSATYTNYILVFSNTFHGVGNTDIRLQWRTSGPTSVITSYFGGSQEIKAAGTTSQSYINNSTYVSLMVMGDSSLPSSGQLNVNGVGTGSQRAQIHGTGLGGYNKSAQNFGNVNSTANTVLGFILFPVSGNISGTVKVYGVQN
jgi:hypothetical protein